jgi:ubiquinol-cytochrome c reductase iron-sulfur subunit
MDEPADLQRRQILLAATWAVGSVGIAAATYPFLSSMSPSERTKAAGAPVTVDLSQEPGRQMTVEWRGKPVWILRRTREMIEALQQSKLLARLSDPNSRFEHQPGYAANAHRSIKPEYSILVGLCTHLGCVPTFRPEPAPPDLGPDWVGGYFCPCHGSKFDLAGRVFKNVPPPTNLVVPPHRYWSDTLVEIGRDAGRA